MQKLKKMCIRDRVYTEDRSGKRVDYTSTDEKTLDLPLAVLVNGYSASAVSYTHLEKKKKTAGLCKRLLARRKMKRQIQSYEAEGEEKVN